MFSVILAAVLWLILTVGWFVVALYIYVALVRQIGVRSAPAVESFTKPFGLPEAMIATFLIALLVLNVLVGASTAARELSTRDLLNNFILTGVVLVILLGFLTLRGFDVDALAGF